jgi:toluene monooxygenase system protein E
MTDAPQVLQPLKTWSHLAERRRRPSEYEVVSVGLHYSTDNPDCPFELSPDLMMNQWYRQYRNDSPFAHPTWNDFRDPDQVVYRTYNVMQDGQETYVDGLLDSFSNLDHDLSLSEEWLDVLASHYTPRRYAMHCLQMLAAYAGQMAPSSTLTNCFFFQSADEMRRIQRVAYRTAELAESRTDRGFGLGERSQWETNPAWQGFRELFEQALVAWDWAESFVATNLVSKPAFDEAIRQFSTVARENGDELLALIDENLLRDADRSRRWSSALCTFAFAADGNRDIVEQWVAKWRPLADAAVHAYLDGLPGGDVSAGAAIAATTAFRAGLGLTH